ncbi:MAG: hypothetical protein IIX61_02085 [Loktanella sp.]|nr:hypothetical protein [Loktanella sp.]
MSNALFIRVSAAILAGFLLGVVFVYLRLRNGLTGEEWGYLREVYICLRAGEYDYIKEDDKDERSDEHDED